MKKIILVNGLIVGIVIIGTYFLSTASDSNTGHLAGQVWLGYLVMIVAFSLIFFGIKQYRDRELGGVIRYGTGVTVGLGITLVASIVYVGVWEVNLAATDYAFINDYTESLIEKSRSEGASIEEMAQLLTETEAMKVQYGKTPYRLIMTFLEIFPVGLLITLLSAAVLRKSSVLSSSPGPDVASDA